MDVNGWEDHWRKEGQESEKPGLYVKMEGHLRRNEIINVQGRGGIGAEILEM